MIGMIGYFHGKVKKRSVTSTSPSRDHQWQDQVRTTGDGNACSGWRSCPVCLKLLWTLHSAFLWPPFSPLNLSVSFPIDSTTDSKLIWIKHVSNTASRVVQKLGALRRVANKMDRRAIVYKAQVQSVMEYASLSWMSASPTTIALLDSIQKNTLWVIGLDVDEARVERNISSIHQRRQVAAVAVLYKMNASKWPIYLCAVLPQPYFVRRATCSSMSMPCHALAVLMSRTVSTGRTFHTAVHVWNSLPDDVVGDITKKKK